MKTSGKVFKILGLLLLSPHISVASFPYKPAIAPGLCEAVLNAPAKPVSTRFKLMNHLRENSDKDILDVISTNGDLKLDNYFEAPLSESSMWINTALHRNKILESSLVSLGKPYEHISDLNKRLEQHLKKSSAKRHHVTELVLDYLSQSQKISADKKREVRNIINPNNHYKPWYLLRSEALSPMEFNYMLLRGFFPIRLANKEGLFFEDVRSLETQVVSERKHLKLDRLDIAEKEALEETLESYRASRAAYLDHLFVNLHSKHFSSLKRMESLHAVFHALILNYNAPANAKGVLKTGRKVLEKLKAKPAELKVFGKFNKESLEIILRETELIDSHSKPLNELDSSSDFKAELPDWLNTESVE